MDGRRALAEASLPKPRAGYAWAIRDVHLHRLRDGHSD